MLTLTCALLAGTASARELRVCVERDDRPFWQADPSGYEGPAATLVVSEPRPDPRYGGLPDRRGFDRKTRGGAPHCDVTVGVPVPADRLPTTGPYHRRAPMLVYRSRWLKRLASFDDPRLRSLRIGVALIGSDLAATPPAHALARRGIVTDVVAFPVAGDRPVAERMIEALGQGRIDVAVLWDGRRGEFAKRAPLVVALTAEEGT